MIISIGFVFNGYFVYLLCHQLHGFNHRLGYIRVASLLTLTEIITLLFFS